VAILANRVRTRNSLIELSKFMLSFIRKSLATLLILLSCFLLYFSYPKTIAPIILDSVGKTLSLGSIIYNQSINGVKSIYSMFSYFQDLETENLKLKLEIAALSKEQELITSLKAENIALREMLNASQAIETKFVTAKIVGSAISPFTSSAMIEAGENENIKVNDIVKGAKGLIGRVAEVGKNYSTVMLINDHNSRIPVMTETSKVHGILAKQEDRLKVIYLQENHNAVVGEIIHTSGEGKIFPRGIPIATITTIKDKEAFVEILDDVNKIDFVVVVSKPE
jgi:rod shape-determining protein MreC